MLRAAFLERCGETGEQKFGIGRFQGDIGRKRYLLRCDKSFATTVA